MAIVPDEKVRDYLLNPNHVTGTNKYRVFRAAFGIEHHDWQSFAERLVSGLEDGVLIGTRDSTDCVLHTVEMTWQGLDGKAKRVITSWKVTHAGGPPSFVTAYLRN